jgi:hypothetical protein
MGPAEKKLRFQSAAWSIALSLATAFSYPAHLYAQSVPPEITAGDAVAQNAPDLEIIGIDLNTADLATLALPEAPLPDSMTVFGLRAHTPEAVKSARAFIAAEEAAQSPNTGFVSVEQELPAKSNPQNTTASDSLRVHRDFFPVPAPGLKFIDLAAGGVRAGALFFVAQWTFSKMAGSGINPNYEQAVHWTAVFTSTLSGLFSVFRPIYLKVMNKIGFTDMVTVVKVAQKHGFPVTARWLGENIQSLVQKRRTSAGPSSDVNEVTASWREIRAAVSQNGKVKLANNLTGYVALEAAILAAIAAIYSGFDVPRYESIGQAVWLIGAASIVGYVGQGIPELAVYRLTEHGDLQALKTATSQKDYNSKMIQVTTLSALSTVIIALLANLGIYASSDPQFSTWGYLGLTGLGSLGAIASVYASDLKTHPTDQIRNRVHRLVARSRQGLAKAKDFCANLLR